MACFWQILACGLCVTKPALAYKDWMARLALNLHI